MAGDHVKETFVTLKDDDVGCGDAVDTNANCS